MKSGAYRIATSRPQLDRLRGRARGAPCARSRRGRRPVRLPCRDRGRGADRGRSRRHLYAALRADRPGAPGARTGATRARGAASRSSSTHRRASSGRDGSRARPGRSALRVVVRATEAFTTRLPGERRTLPPALPRTCSRRSRCHAQAWDEIGWTGCAPIADQHYQFRLRTEDTGRADRPRRARTHLQPRRHDQRRRRGTTAASTAASSRPCASSSRAAAGAQITHR